MAQGGHHEPDPLSHVLDQHEIHLFDRLFGGLSVPLFSIDLGFYKFQLTKFMVLELIAAGLILWIFTWLAKRISSGGAPTGRAWNMFESLLTFVREEIAKPNIGEKEADRFVPYLWTVFLFILFCNLLGMIPWMGSPTANISVTGALAVLSFLLMHAAPIVRYGPKAYLKSMWLDTGLPWYTILPIVIGVLIFVIELLGTVIKSFVLAVRLFANMFAGHMVLAMILMFIVVVGNKGYSNIWPVVTTASVLGVVALSLLELFVAFLQAFVFTFLTALFIGMALHHCEEHEHGHDHGDAHGHGHGHAAAH